jgi:hypothetical protein
MTLARVLSEIVATLFRMVKRWSMKSDRSVNHCEAVAIGSGNKNASLSCAAPLEYSAVHEITARQLALRLGRLPPFGGHPACGFLS